MDTVFTHADEVLVLNLGELIAQGTPAQVRKNKLVQQVYLGAGTTYANHNGTNGAGAKKVRGKRK
jgi:branched-chain amino acid transport system ATP-binding protein